MERVEIKIPTRRYDCFVKGWLFSCCGLRLVAHKKHDFKRQWGVSEYSTGQAIPIRWAWGWSKIVTTRKDAIECARQFMASRSSISVCTAVQKAITENGILN